MCSESERKKPSSLSHHHLAIDEATILSRTIWIWYHLKPETWGNRRNMRTDELGRSAGDSTLQYRAAIYGLPSESTTSIYQKTNGKWITNAPCTIVYWKVRATANMLPLRHSRPKWLLIQLTMEVSRCLLYRGSYIASFEWEKPYHNQKGIVNPTHSFLQS